MKLLRLKRKFIRPVLLFIKRKKIPTILFVLGYVIGVLVGIITLPPKEEMISPRGCQVVNLTVESNIVEPIKELKSWTGLASYYSREGCVGCSANLHMANGKPLVDENLTVAFNKLPLGSKVKVTNLKNNQSVVATVTDTGGFEKLGRIIDLTIGTKTAINCSDLCSVSIEEL